MVHTHEDAWSQLSIFANLGIVAGYLLVPVTALRLVPLKWPVRVAGMTFFVTCAITHLSMAFGSADHGLRRGWQFWFMLADHTVQAVAVWAFILGLSCAVRDAMELRRRRRAVLPGEVDGGSDGSRRRF